MLAFGVLLLVWALLGALAGLVAIPWTMATRSVDFLYAAGLLVIRAGFRAAGIEAAVHGRDRVPASTACIYIANHQSNLDPPLLASLQPGHSAMMLKQSLMKIPMLGYAMRLAHFIPVDRSGKLEDARHSLRQAAGVLRSGTSLTIFPEGTRSPDGKLLPFKSGPFFLAMQTGVPVVPVTISGTGAMLGKGSSRLRPGTARVTFHAPLDPQAFQSREALRDAVRAAIQSALPG